MQSACERETTAPPAEPSLQIVAGANRTDTISSEPTHGLVVEVHGEDGSPAVGVEVRFEAPTESRMEVGAVSQPGYSADAGTVTDNNGRAVVRVRFSTRVGAGWIAAQVPLYSLTDTARYTVLPGAPVRVRPAPRDTAIRLPSTFSLRGTTADRAGNPRNDPATYEVIGSAVAVASGRVTAMSYGIARVRLRATIAGVTSTDSMSVGVVPPGRLAWSESTHMSALNISEVTGASRFVFPSCTSRAASPRLGNRAGAASFTCRATARWRLARSAGPR